MSLNYLLHRHQVSLARSRTASGPEARLCHAELARGYARLIEERVGAQRDAGRPLVPLA